MCICFLSAVRGFKVLEAPAQMFNSVRDAVKEHDFSPSIEPFQRECVSTIPACIYPIIGAESIYKVLYVQSCLHSYCMLLKDANVALVTLYAKTLRQLLRLSGHRCIFAKSLPSRMYYKFRLAAYSIPNYILTSGMSQWHASTDLRY